jgi:glycosyltransferase involved in cell wall biosynthesis
MYYMIMPRTVPPFQRAYWKVFLPLSSRVCDVILTVSNNSGKDIETFLPAAAGKVVVTPLASRFTPAEPDTVLATLPTTQQYVLMIANLTPNKNVGKVVEALAILRGRGRKVDLVHIGSDHLGELASASARHAAGEWVRSLGKVSDEELIERARGCLALVVPSLYEGFGMPAMEALALGAPLICSNRGALPEVAGEAALIVDPVDAPQIADAITALIDDPTLRPRLQQAGLERAAQFSWVRTAEQTLEAFARHLPPARFAPAEFGRSAAD